MLYTSSSYCHTESISFPHSFYKNSADTSVSWDFSYNVLIIYLRCAFFFSWSTFFFIICLNLNSFFSFSLAPFILGSIFKRISSFRLFGLLLLTAFSLIIPFHYLLMVSSITGGILSPSHIASKCIVHAFSFVTLCLPWLIFMVSIIKMSEIESADYNGCNMKWELPYEIFSGYKISDSVDTKWAALHNMPPILITCDVIWSKADHTTMFQNALEIVMHDKWIGVLTKRKCGLYREYREFQTATREIGTTTFRTYKRQLLK